jgi:tRNA G18 (ribose-2'-O)-methylase SpoU
VQPQAIGVHHPRIHQIFALQRNTAPNPRRLFVAEGLWAHEVLLQTGTPIEAFFWCPEAGYSDQVVARSKELAAVADDTYQISAKTLQRIAERDRPDGLVSIARLPSWEPDDLAAGESALVLVADGLEIPGNLGTLIRTLDACRADGLVLTNRKVRLTHPKVFRASHGTSLTVPTVEFDTPDETMEWLRRKGFEILLADTGGAHYRAHAYPGRTALVVGNERKGISREWYANPHTPLAVPMLGLTDSLNVAISASLLLYEARAHKDGW